MLHTFVPISRFLTHIRLKSPKTLLYDTCQPLLEVFPGLVLLLESLLDLGFEGLEFLETGLMLVLFG
jgi:hypothetical protein